MSKQSGIKRNIIWRIDKIITGESPKKALGSHRMTTAAQQWLHLLLPKWQRPLIFAKKSCSLA
jgi:hypothetical protein